MDKNQEKISSSVSSLEKKFDKLDARVKLETNQSEARGKVKKMKDGLNELNKRVNELKAANEKVNQVNCEKAMEYQQIYREKLSSEGKRLFDANKEGKCAFFSRA